jgi:hypothetical protein
VVKKLAMLVELEVRCPGLVEKRREVRRAPIRWKEGLMSMPALELWLDIVAISSWCAMERSDVHLVDEHMVHIG